MNYAIRTLAAPSCSRRRLRFFQQQHGGVLPASSLGRLSVEVNDTDARLWHPWLRFNRVLRVMLQTRWSAEAWSQVRVEFRKVLALRSQIRRRGMVQLKGTGGASYRLALTWDMVPAVNAELKALVTAGADWIQIDEPSAAIVPGQIDEYVKMFNACVDSVRAKIGLHVCFGNLLSRPRGKRSYRWMFPALKSARCDQFVFEYANREMAEIDDWKDYGVDREVACGVVDVKSFYLESPEEVAERIALCAKYIPVDKLSAVPDCGFFPVPRWLAFEKLKRLAAGAALARKKLGVA